MDANNLNAAMDANDLIAAIDANTRFAAIDANSLIANIQPIGLISEEEWAMFRLPEEKIAGYHSLLKGPFGSLAEGFSALQHKVDDMNEVHDAEYRSKRSSSPSSGPATSRMRTSSPERSSPGSPASAPSPGL